MRTNFPLVTAFFAAALLSGCATIDSMMEEDSLPSLQGESRESIEGATVMTFAQGRLVVGSSGAFSGLAIIDTGTETITRFHPFQLPPTSMALDAVGDLAFVRSENGRFAYGILAPTQGNLVSKGTAGKGEGRLFQTETGLQLSVLDGNSYRLFAMTTAQGWGATGEPFQKRITAVAFSSGKLFVAEQGSHFLLRYPWEVAQGVHDTTIPITHDSPLDPHTTRITALTSRSGFVFAAVTRGPAATDSSSYVAVINATTGTVVKTIPLSFRNPVSGKVRGHTWYLSAPGASWESSGNHVADGGVEAIDLEIQTHAGIIVTEAELGGEIHDFVATAPGRGYGIVGVGDGAARREIRKIYFPSN